MPNWCVNRLNVIGNEAEVNKFRVYIKGGKEFDFNKVIPCPIGYKEPNPIFRPVQVVDIEYDWCSENWGSRWNVDDIVVTDNGINIQIDFRTAWCPPIPVIKKLIEIFPKLCFTLEYCERGAAFSGTISGSKGEVESNFCGRYYGFIGG